MHKDLSVGPTTFTGNTQVKKGAKSYPITFSVSISGLHTGSSDVHGNAARAAIERALSKSLASAFRTSTKSAIQQEASSISQALVKKQSVLQGSADSQYIKSGRAYHEYRDFLLSTAKSAASGVNLRTYLLRLTAGTLQRLIRRQSQREGVPFEDEESLPLDGGRVEIRRWEAISCIIDNIIAESVKVKGSEAFRLFKAICYKRMRFSYLRDHSEQKMPQFGQEIARSIQWPERQQDTENQEDTKNTFFDPIFVISHVSGKSYEKIRRELTDNPDPDPLLLRPPPVSAQTLKFLGISVRDDSTSPEGTMSSPTSDLVHHSADESNTTPEESVGCEVSPENTLSPTTSLVVDDQLCETSRKRPSEPKEPCTRNKRRRRNLSSQTWDDVNMSWRGHQEILNNMGASTEDTSQRRDEQPTGQCTTRHTSCDMSGSATASFAGDTAALRGTSQYDLNVTAAYFSGNDYDLDVTAAYFSGNDYDLDVTAAYFSGNNHDLDVTAAYFSSNNPAALQGSSQYDLDNTAAYFSGNNPAALQGSSQYDLDNTAAYFSGNDPAALQGSSQYDLDNTAAYFSSNNPAALQGSSQYDLDNTAAYFPAFLPQAEQAPQQCYLANP